MVRIYFEKAEEPLGDSVVRYVAEDFSIELNATRSKSHGGVLVKDIALELDAEGCVVSLGGLCSHHHWEKSDLVLPSYCLRRVRIDLGRNLDLGVYDRIEQSDTWNIVADPKNRILCIGDRAAVGKAACFLPGAIIVLTSNSVVAALWLFDVEGMV